MEYCNQVSQIDESVTVKITDYSIIRGNLYKCSGSIGIYRTVDIDQSFHEIITAEGRRTMGG
jgi:hypothetical protein